MVGTVLLGSHLAPAFFPGGMAQAMRESFGAGGLFGGEIFDEYLVG